MTNANGMDGVTNDQRREDNHEPTELKLRLNGVPLDNYFGVARGTPDEHLEFVLKESIKQAAIKKEGA